MYDTENSSSPQQSKRGLQIQRGGCDAIPTTFLQICDERVFGYRETSDLGLNIGK